MTRRLAKKIAGNPWRYTNHQCARAYRRLYRGDPERDCDSPTGVLAWYLRGPEAIGRSRAALRWTRKGYRRVRGMHDRTHIMPF